MNDRKRDGKETRRTQSAYRDLGGWGRESLNSYIFRLWICHAAHSIQFRIFQAVWSQVHLEAYIWASRELAGDGRDAHTVASIWVGRDLGCDGFFNIKYPRVGENSNKISSDRAFVTRDIRSIVLGTVPGAGWRWYYCPGQAGDGLLGQLKRRRSRHRTL